MAQWYKSGITRIYIVLYMYLDWMEWTNQRYYFNATRNHTAKSYSWQNHIIYVSGWNIFFSFEMTFFIPFTKVDITILIFDTPLKRGWQRKSYCNRQKSIDWFWWNYIRIWGTMWLWLLWENHSGKNIFDLLFVWCWDNKFPWYLHKLKLYSASELYVSIKSTNLLIMLEMSNRIHAEYRQRFKAQNSKHRKLWLTLFIVFFMKKNIFFAIFILLDFYSDKKQLK